jgi:hypothetical protein
MLSASGAAKKALSPGLQYPAGYHLCSLNSPQRGSSFDNAHAVPWTCRIQPSETQA